jgi:ribosome-binding factor A
VSIRTERVASLIKEEIGSLLTKEYAGQGLGFTTVTSVEVTPDLRQARVFVSVFGAPEVRTTTMAFLEDETPHIRSLLAGRIRLRFMPSVTFILDDTLDRVDRINTLIKQIHRDDPADDTKNPNEPGDAGR